MDPWLSMLFCRLKSSPVTDCFRLFFPEPLTWRLWLKEPRPNVMPSCRDVDVSRSNLSEEDADPAPPPDEQLTEMQHAGAVNANETRRRARIIHEDLQAIGTLPPSTQFRL